MPVKIGFAGDLHKRARDITTIKGYVNCTLAVQRKLMQMIKDLQLDLFCSLGDWYDKGYISDVAASLSDYDIDIEMAKVLNGQFYGLIGNHIRLNMDSNPELHLIQPHPIYKSRRSSPRKEQILKTPDILRFYDVQISFMHHRMNADNVLDYKPVKESWAKYHIALFHTPFIIPNAQLINTNMSYNSSSNSKIAEALDGVDLAIVGDIHKPLGQFTVNNKSGQTTMIVPGSLTNVDAGEINRHTSIMIPIVTIDNDSTVKLEYNHFDLLTNMVTFNQKNLHESREKIKSLRGKAIKDLHQTEDVVAVLGRTDNIYTSLNGFMQAQRYTNMDKQLIRSVIDTPDDIKNLLSIYREGEF